MLQSQLPQSYSQAVRQPRPIRPPTRLLAPHQPSLIPPTMPPSTHPRSSPNSRRSRTSTPGRVRFQPPETILQSTSGMPMTSGRRLPPPQIQDPRRRNPPPSSSTRRSHPYSNGSPHGQPNTRPTPPPPYRRQTPYPRAPTTQTRNFSGTGRSTWLIPNEPPQLPAPILGPDLLTMTVVLTDESARSRGMMTARVPSDVRLAWNGSTILALRLHETLPMPGEGTLANPIVVDALTSSPTTPTQPAHSTAGAIGALTTGTQALIVTNPTSNASTPSPV
jgi:hypothetical protein